jgi:monoterpene epsilon-lactone hydrolase
MPSPHSHLFRLMMLFGTRRIRDNVPVERIRAGIARSTRFIGPPRGTTVASISAAGIPAYWIQAKRIPDAPVMLYVHGGGFIVGWNNQYFIFLSHLSRATGTRVLGIDYRLAPEHPFPAAVEDCLASYRWLLQQHIAPQQVVIAGDSAGGNLALATLLALRDAGDPLPAAAVCLSPATDFTGSGPTFATRASVDPALTVEFARTVGKLYAGEADPRHPLLSPLFGDLRGLPPLMIHVGNDEILLSDSLQFTERARAAGSFVALKVWPHLWHVFPIYAPFLPEARQAVTEIGIFVRERIAGAMRALARPSSAIAERV